MNLAELPNLQLFLDAVHWTARSAPYLGAAALTAGGIWGWAARRRTRRARTALAHRTVVEVVPTATFDPGEGEVGRWGHHLGRVRYAADNIPDRGAAVRLRYSADGGQMHCFIEGPVEAAAVLGMPGFAEVEVRSARPGKDIEPVRFTLPAQRKVASQ